MLQKSIRQMKIGPSSKLNSIAMETTTALPIPMSTTPKTKEATTQRASGENLNKWAVFSSDSTSSFITMKHCSAFMFLKIKAIMRQGESISAVVSLQRRVQMMREVRPIGIRTTLWMFLMRESRLSTNQLVPGETGSNLTGYMSKSNSCKSPIPSPAEEIQHHLATIGQLIEESQSSMRQYLESVYVIRTKEALFTTRYQHGLQAEQQKRQLAEGLKNIRFGKAQ